MAKNFVAPGDTMDVTLAADAASGDPIAVGNKVVVALEDGLSGAAITAKTTGVFELPKVAGAITQGADVYLTSAGEITVTATDNTLAGYAYQAAASGDATVYVTLK